MQDLIALGEDVVSQAKRAGLDVAEVLVRRGSELSAKVRLGEVEALEEASHRSISMRVMKNRRVAMTATSDLSDHGIKRFLDDAVELAELSQEDPFSGPADPSMLAAGPFDHLELFDEDVDKLSATQAIDLALQAEAAALSYDSRITNMQGTTCGRASGETAMVLSNGFRSAWKRSMVSLSSTALADDADGKKRRDSWYEARRHLAAMPPAEEVGREAARRTLRMLGATKIESCEVPVVFPEETARALLGLFASCAVGSSIWRRASYLVGRTNTLVASEHVTIVDDPFIRRGYGSRPHDGEGLLSRENLVVERGILRTYLCDCYSARKLETSSTASAARGSSADVGPSTTNFVLKPVAGMTEQDIIRSTKKGLYVTEMIGFGFNATTGDFSRGASGLWIEDGQLTFPVSEVTISLNLLDLFQRVDAVAQECKLRSATLCPSIRVSSMTVAGK